MELAFHKITANMLDLGVFSQYLFKARCFEREGET